MTNLTLDVHDSGLVNHTLWRDNPGVQFSTPFPVRDGGGLEPLRSREARGQISESGIHGKNFHHYKT